MIWTVLTYIGIGLGGLVVSYMMWMLFIALVSGVSAPDQPLERRRREESGKWRDAGFDVKGTRIAARLYVPDDASSPVPCVVMAHGLGGTMAAGLDAPAVLFQKAGFAVLAFDYRHLGESDGEPRQLVWIPSQLEDYRAAIAHARSLDVVDADRIALWGTSLSGGHVLVTAAADERIACVVGQCPLLAGDAGGWEVVKRMGGLGFLLKLAFVHGLRDIVRGWIGLGPHTIPLVGRPGTVAVMADQDAWDFFNAVAPEGFVNRACARILIRMDKYHPVHHASKIRCPVLLQTCEKDVSSPASIVEKAEKALGANGRVVRLPIDHFDIYLGDPFEKAVAEQIAFLEEHLKQVS